MLAWIYMPSSRACPSIAGMKRMSAPFSSIRIAMVGRDRWQLPFLPMSAALANCRPIAGDLLAFLVTPYDVTITSRSRFAFRPTFPSEAGIPLASSALPPILWPRPRPDLSPTWPRPRPDFYPFCPDH
jgi:hypothetical protein